MKDVKHEQTSALRFRISVVSLLARAAPSSMEATLSANLSVLIVSPIALASGFIWTNIRVLACPPTRKLQNLYLQKSKLREKELIYVKRTKTTNDLKNLGGLE